MAASPGANNLLVLRHGMTHGSTAAVVGLLGRLVAFSLMVAAVVAGLGPLLAASELALSVLKWAGVAYLAWLGVRTLWRGPLSAETDGDGVVERRRVLVRREFLVAVTNPKAVLLFTAFVPQFVEPGPAVTQELLVLGALYIVVEAVTATCYGLFGGMVRSVRLSMRAPRRLDQGTGVTMLGMAGVLALHGR